MSVKQPQNLNSPQALAQAVGGVVRPFTQPGQRPAPFQDDTQKDTRGKVREGHNKAFHDTFGSGSFDANVGDGNSYAGDMTISEATYSAPGEDYYDEKAREMRFVEASFRAADIAAGGDGNPYTLDDHAYDHYYYDSYDRYDYYTAPRYDSYTGTFDTSDPQTQQYLDSARLSFNEEGKLTAIDDGVSCLRVDGKSDRANAILNSYAEGGPQNLTNKVDEVKAAVADADGYLNFDGKRIHVNSPNGKQIIVAQQQLAAGVEPTALGIKNILNQSPEELAAAKKNTLALDKLDKVPGLGNEDIFIATGTPKTGSEQDPKFQTMMAKTISPAAGQGGDFFMVSKALKDSNFSQMSKPSELSASTTAPATAEPAPPPLGSTIMRPAAPAPGFPA